MARDGGLATFVPKTENPNVPPEELCRVTALAPARTGDVWVGLSVVVDDCMLGATAITPGDHLLRFDPSGNLVTERRFPRGPEGFAAIQALSATRDGSVTVGGLFGGEVDLGKGKVFAQQGTTSGYVARYDRDLVLVWARVFGGEHGSGNVLDLATGPDDQTLVGGLIDGDATLAGTSMPGTGERGFLAQLDPQSGPTWVRTIAERVQLVDYSPLGTAVAVALGSSATWGEHTGTGGEFLITAEKDGTPRWLRTWSMAGVRSRGGRRGRAPAARVRARVDRLRRRQGPRRGHGAGEARPRRKPPLDPAVSAHLLERHHRPLDRGRPERSDRGAARVRSRCLPGR